MGNSTDSVPAVIREKKPSHPSKATLPTVSLITPPVTPPITSLKVSDRGGLVEADEIDRTLQAMSKINSLEAFEAFYDRFHDVQPDRVLEAVDSELYERFCDLVELYVEASKPQVQAAQISLKGCFTIAHYRQACKQFPLFVLDAARSRLTGNSKETIDRLHDALSQRS